MSRVWPRPAAHFPRSPAPAAAVPARGRRARAARPGRSRDGRPQSTQYRPLHQGEVGRVRPVKVHRLAQGNGGLVIRPDPEEFCEVACSVYGCSSTTSPAVPVISTNRGTVGSVGIVESSRQTPSGCSARKRATTGTESAATNVPPPVCSSRSTDQGQQALLRRVEEVPEEVAVLVPAATAGDGGCHGRSSPTPGLAMKPSPQRQGSPSAPRRQPGPGRVPGLRRELAGVQVLA